MWLSFYSDVLWITFGVKVGFLYVNKDINIFILRWEMIKSMENNRVRLEVLNRSLNRASKRVWLILLPEHNNLPLTQVKIMGDILCINWTYLLWHKQKVWQTFRSIHLKLAKNLFLWNLFVSLYKYCWKSHFMNGLKVLWPRIINVTLFVQVIANFCFRGAQIARNANIM